MLIIPSDQSHGFFPLYQAMYQDKIAYGNTHMQAFSNLLAVLMQTNDR